MSLEHACTACFTAVSTRKVMTRMPLVGARAGERGAAWCPSVELPVAEGNPKHGSTWEEVTIGWGRWWVQSCELLMYLVCAAAVDAAHALLPFFDLS